MSAPWSAPPSSAPPSSAPPTRVLFVCWGNICRSPTAEAVMRRTLDQQGLSDLIEVDSAGTSAEHAGDPPDPYYGGPDGFTAVFDLLEDACRGLVDHLRAGRLAPGVA